MKKLLGFIIDILFFFVLWFAILLSGIVMLYARTNDLAVINDILREYIYPTILAVYGSYFACLIVYFVIIPTFLKSTVGEFIFKLRYDPLNNVTLLTVFLRNVIGFLWDFVAFPYNLFAVIKKKTQFKRWFSGITLISDPTFPRKKGGFILVILFALGAIGLTSLGGYIYRTGPIFFIEQFINHQKQTEFYIKQSGYTTAKLSLEKYKRYNGETADYHYYNCVIESHITSDEKALEICNTALAANTSNNDRTQEMLALKANLLRVNYKPKESLAIYDELWTKYNLRTFEMVNYVYILDSQSERGKAVEILNELYKTLTEGNKLDNVQKMYFGELYYTVEKYEESLAIYTKMLENPAEQGVTLNMLGDIYYKQGQCFYHLGKLTEAKDSFAKAKENNPDYADSADAYIIEIDFRAKKRK